MENKISSIFKVVSLIHESTFNLPTFSKSKENRRSYTPQTSKKSLSKKGSKGNALNRDKKTLSTLENMSVMNG